MSDTLYKRCKCRGDDEKDLGASCPKLRRADGSWNPKHGTWYFALELPRGPGGKRRPRMRRGGFGSRDEAGDAREAAKATLRKGADPSLRLTMERYLTDWLAGRVDLRRSVRRNYTISVNTYLIPLLGHIQLGDLATEDVAGAFATIREWNDLLAAGKPVRKYQRHVGPAAMQRIRAVLRGALNDAERDGKIEYNPAARVRMETGRTARPALWTPERTSKFWAAHEQALAETPSGRGDRAFLVWRSMTLRPFPVMVWTPADLGMFLDYAARHRLAPLFELAAATAMRRGELCGLPWSEVDLDAGVIHITTARVQAGWEVVEGGPKSEAGHRDVPLLPEDVAGLKAWKRQQAKERLAWGEDWQQTGLVFTKEDGSAWHPGTVTDTFERLAFAAHLPPVRLHDVRHENITRMFAAGIDVKVIQERVGHSGSKMTRDYAAVGEEVSRAAAEKAASLIPRKAAR
jgi:integrase